MRKRMGFLVIFPVKTLRFYDDMGLLRPIQVDAFTGYRYYEVRQLPRLIRILALKDLGFTLEQIAPILEEGVTPEEIRGMLRLKHSEIEQRIEIQGAGRGRGRVRSHCAGHET